VRVSPWLNEAIEKPKDIEGLGVKNIKNYRKALVSKCVWRLIQNKGMWSKGIIQKYIEPNSIEY